MSPLNKIHISEENEGQRLDVMLASLLAGTFSRSQIKRFITEEKVTVNSKKAKANYLLKSNDEVVLDPPSEKESELEASDIPIEIVHEDEDLLVVNKEAGLVVHPGAGKHEHTLVQALLHHTSHALSSGSAKFRPGIVHRLDKDTSGLLVVAKNDWTHERLATQFKEHSIGRTYWVLVRGGSSTTSSFDLRR